MSGTVATLFAGTDVRQNQRIGTNWCAQHKKDEKNMIAIVNVTPLDKQSGNVHQYEVRINRRVVATFEHCRTFDGAAQCLRSVADAIDKCRETDREALQALLRGSYEMD